jgi:peptidoglycan hydrolase-like protein with peptidoglycan-binding domain
MSIIALAAVTLMVSACGSSQKDRAASGAGIGATAGAAVGAVTGLSILQGALLGAAAGGLTGAMTKDDFINLGDPIWATDKKPANRSATARIQAGLSTLGYAPGPIDGIHGTKTTSAIRSYQADNGLLVDGVASQQLAEHIEAKL